MAKLLGLLFAGVVAVRREFYSDQALTREAQQSPEARLAWDKLATTLEHADSQITATSPPLLSASAGVTGLPGTLDQNVIFETYCEHDYSSACPPDWKESSSSGYCMAGISYSGALDPYFPIPHTKDEKQTIESKYQLRWPCLTTCLQDYTQPCPVGWAIQNSGLCISHDPEAPTNFNGFNATESDRRVFSSANGFPWPCKEGCQRDYHSFPCPLGWEQVLVEGVKQCQAPNWYQGGCPGLQSVSGLTTDLLRQFEDRCHVQFPCRRCQLKDYAAECPLGFQLTSGHSCQRQVETTSAVQSSDSCPDVISATVTEEEKVELEDWCGVSWPCAEQLKPQCAQDFRNPCPMTWTVGDTPEIAATDGTVCTANVDYIGRCPRTIRITQTNLFKRAFSQHCQVSWPCLNDSAPELWLGGNRKIAVPARAVPSWEPSDSSGPIDRIGNIFSFEDETG